MNSPLRSWHQHFPGTLVAAAVFLAMLLGLYARFRGLGVWPLADDEYHTMESVENILNKGLPAFECGGYYVRGVLYQYLLAMMSFVTGIEHTPLFRVVTALSGLLCLPPLYFIARKLGGRYVAMGVIALLMISVWEVEYARYIRMYAPFQAMFVWYLYFLFKILVEQDKTSFKWIYLLSFVSVFVYEAGIFLVLLNFFPVLSGKIRLTTARVLIPIVILASVYIFLTYNFRFIGAESQILKDAFLQPVTDTFTLGHLVFPKTFIHALRETQEWYIPLYLLLVIIAGILYPVITSRDTHTRYKLIFPFWVLLAIMNQYSMIVYSAAVFWLIGWLGRDGVRGKDVMYLFTALLATVVFWVVYALNTSAWHTFYSSYSSGVEQPFWKMLAMFLKYPNLIDKIFRPWMAGIPTTVILSASVIATGFLVSRKDKNPVAREYFRLLLALTIILSLLVAITVQPYNSSRYTFFLYPVVILLVMYSICQIASLLSSRKAVQTWIFLLLTGSYVALADDYYFKHLLQVDSAKFNFRTVYGVSKKFHLFNRMDFRTPAEYVNKSMGQDDVVIASVRPAHYYLDRLDYFYMDPNNRELSGVSACDGKKEIWTNAGLLYSQEKLLEIIAGSSEPVWLIIRSDEYPYAWETERMIGDSYSDRLVYRSIDRSVAVYRFDN